MHTRLSLIFVAAMVLSLALTGLASASGSVPWSYEGDTGPAYWGTLSPRIRSLLDRAGAVAGRHSCRRAAKPGELDQKYEAVPLTIVNNGHTIEVEYEPGSTFTVDGVPFTLSQFHLHSESEHTLAGQRYPMELHLVHKAADGRLAVIGVMVQAGSENPAWKPVLDNMPAEEGAPQHIAGVSVNAADLLPADKSFYRYNGSLTTPPCTQGVNWFVMRNAVELSAAQIDQFRAIYSDNYRPVQPLNGRAFLAADAALAAAAAPANLPATGGLPFDPVAVLMIGVVLAGAGACFRRRAA